MTFHSGFDTYRFPGYEALAWLRQHTPLTWCGYYLGPSPSHLDCGWMGKRGVLLQQGWGFAPVYVGQQTCGPGKHCVTAERGIIDGAQAAELASVEGFPAGSTLYLDWEDGGTPDADALAYIGKWMQAMNNAGYAPGIYCSHLLAQQLSAQFRNGRPPRVWAWKVGTTSRHPYTGQIEQLIAADPAGCGYPQATLWQFEQNAVLRLPCPSCNNLQVDISHSTLPDPSAL
ncbi:hypothetical protein FHR53_001717 [Xanthomonas arboricola]|uniref:Rv2525c-like glycoside hydrolase-like domain-containing protein n=1 Tax=Xanthomonas cannabis pv. phaseoli TaxID=1885902 RepID=A0AB34P7V8_9XANT|nr:glycoside hydrolase domain-containing protein [Xanthomonas cannabis]KGK57303.1 hypothetical protein NC00_13375 [Xanthomonas cannabis pv. phaseoli]NIK01125.1 hypothetical protein [Xanthomonas cannabis]NIK65121.1 hypothetical protein [Xanthomonas cannabis]